MFGVTKNFEKLSIFFVTKNCFLFFKVFFSTILRGEKKIFSFSLTRLAFEKLGREIEMYAKVSGEKAKMPRENQFEEALTLMTIHKVDVGM